MPKLALSIATTRADASRDLRVLHLPMRNRSKSALRRQEGSPALLEALDAVTAFAAAPAYRRRAIERTVEALIAILDHMDGDPDLEPQDEGADDFEDLRELWATTRAEGPGDPDDAEENGDMEENGDRELDLCDEESLQPNHHLSAAFERPSNLFARRRPAEVA